MNSGLKKYGFRYLLVTVEIIKKLLKKKYTNNIFNTCVIELKLNNDNRAYDGHIIVLYHSGIS